MLVHIPVSIGELIDKITILEIKHQRIKDHSKLTNIVSELAMLSNIRDSLLLPMPVVDLTQQLYSINQQLWDIEDFKRKCEKAESFDEEFVQAARNVYLFNDTRASLKREINHLCGSTLTEEKSHDSISSAANTQHT